MRQSLVQAFVAGVALAGCAGHAASTERTQRVSASSIPAVALKPSGSALDRAFEDYDASRYAAAESKFRSLLSQSEPRARLGLCQVLLITGRYELAEATAEDTVGAPPVITLELVRIRGEALRRQGKLKDAEKVLASAAGDPAARHV